MQYYGFGAWINCQNNLLGLPCSFFVHDGLILVFYKISNRHRDLEGIFRLHDESNFSFVFQVHMPSKEFFRDLMCLMWSDGTFLSFSHFERWCYIVSVIFVVDFDSIYFHRLQLLTIAGSFILQAYQYAASDSILRLDQNSTLAIGGYWAKLDVSSSNPASPWISLGHQKYDFQYDSTEITESSIDSGGTKNSSDYSVAMSIQCI